MTLNQQRAEMYARAEYLLVHDATYRLTRIALDVRNGYSIQEAIDLHAPDEPVREAVTRYIAQAMAHGGDEGQIVQAALANSRRHGSY